MEFDDILIKIGGLGRVQIALYILLGLLGIPCGLQNLGMVFFGATMEHWCSVPELSHLTAREVQHISSVYDSDHKPSSCKYYNLNYSSYDSAALLSWNRSELLSNMTEVKECDSWHFDTSQFKSSAKSQWNLVCSKSYITSLMQTFYMCGFLVGAITFGVLSDRYGRLKVMCLCLLLQIVFAVSAAIVSVYSHYVLFIVLRVAVGMVTAGLFTVAFVLVMEIIPPRFRTYTGLFYQGFFAIGFCLLPGISYALRDMLYTQLAMTLPTILLLSYYWFIPESPRWLILKGMYKEAEIVLRKIARLNKCPLPEDFTVKPLTTTLASENKEQAGIVSMLKRPKLRARALVCSYCWFICGLTYYGTSYSAEALGGDIFLNSLISGLVEYPAYILCFFIVGHPRIGRKYSLVGSFFVSGVSLLACIPLLGKPQHHTLLLVFANIGKLGSAAAFSIVYIFTAEIFPTVVRSASVGGCSLCARIGALLSSPILLMLKFWVGIPYMIFGVLAIVGGGVTFLLPESVNQILPETIEDGELFGSQSYHARHHLSQDEKPSGQNGQQPSNPAENDNSAEMALMDNGVST